MLGCSRLGVDIFLRKRNTVDENSIIKEDINTEVFSTHKFIEEFGADFIRKGFVEVVINVK